MKHGFLRSCSALLPLVLLSGCGAAPAPSTVPGATVPEPTPLPQASTVSPAATDPALDDIRAQLPRMDGSTSLIPLEAGLRAALFGLTMEEATAQVSHSTTWDSFYNLLYGQTDLIFSVPLSQEQQAEAAALDIPLEQIPLALEGFVFVVNAQNPVDSLTAQQLRDIYSGRVTNWSQVGGLDEPILPYQRNQDSGSQNYMIEFMGDAPLMDAPTEFRPASMSGLMDVIAVNDNARGAIGYSVYAYAADMYGNGSEIKFLQVDGVAPSRQTFADGTYPLLGKNYAVFRADEPQHSPARRLAAWAAGPEGQAAIARAGYVPVSPVDYVPEESQFEKYQATGTGSVPTDPGHKEYNLYWRQDSAGYAYDTPRIPLTVVARPDGTRTYELQCLADEDLQAQINDFIAAQMVWAYEQYPRLQSHVDRLNGDREFGAYTLDSYDPITHPQGMPAACVVTARNGILSVAVSACYYEIVMDIDTYYYRTETASWDLITGARLAPEQLFAQGVDIAQALNRHIRAWSQRPDHYGRIPALLREFAALPVTGWHLTHDRIYFDQANPYFPHPPAVSILGLGDGILANESPVDFSDALAPGSAATVRPGFRRTGAEFYYEYTSDELLSCGYLREEFHPNAAAINARVRTHLEEHFTESAIRSYFRSQGLDDSGLDLYMLDWSAECWGGKYLCFRGWAPEYYVEETNSFVPYPCQDTLLFSLDTGAELSWRDLLLPGWEDSAQWNSEGAPPSYPDLPCGQFYLDLTGDLLVDFSENGRYFCLTIPSQWINYD